MDPRTSIYARRRARFAGFSSNRARAAGPSTRKKLKEIRGVRRLPLDGWGQFHVGTDRVAAWR